LRAELGSLALVLGACFAGFGVLVALRWVRLDLRDVIAALGLAFMVGVAVVLLFGVALLCVGVSVGLVTLAVIAGLVGGAGYAMAWRRAGSPQPTWGKAWASVRARLASWPSGATRLASEARVDGWVAALVIVALVVLGVLTFRWARVQPLTSWDAWSIWARKGILLYRYGHLPTAFFTSPVYSFMHPDYPLLLPLYESSWFHAAGAVDTQSLHIWFWVLFVAFLWAAAYIASRVVRPAIWAPLVGLIAVTPAIWTQLMTMYADVPMALFLMLGTLLVGLWLADHRVRDLALATVLLAASATTKDEGLTAAVGVLAAATIVTASFGFPGLPRARALASLGVANVGFLMLIAPWRLWVAAHHIPTEIDLRKGLSPAYVSAHSGRVAPTVEALYGEVTNQGEWSYLLPLALALGVAGLALRRLRATAAFYCVATLAASTTIVWAYVVNPSKLSWLIANSAPRTVMGPMMIAVAGVFHLSAELTRGIVRQRSREERRGSRARTTRRVPTRSGSPRAQPAGRR
jgi:hypothetical protein